MRPEERENQRYAAGSVNPIEEEEKVLLVVAYNLSKSENQGWSKIKSAVQKAEKMAEDAAA